MVFDVDANDDNDDNDPIVVDVVFCTGLVVIIAFEDGDGLSFFLSFCNFYICNDVVAKKIFVVLTLFTVVIDVVFFVRHCDCCFIAVL